MLNMSEREARRQFVARQGALQTLELTEAYNTGATTTTGGAVEYINLWLLGRCLQVFSTGTGERSAYPQRLCNYSFLTTGGRPDFQVNTVKCLVRWAKVVADLATPAKFLTKIRTTFLLSVQDAAAVLKVSRPTVYQWQTLNQMDQIRAHRDRDRLMTLYRLAKEWDRLGQLSGRWLTLPLERTGATVLDILCADAIDENALLQAHREIAELRPQLAEAEHRTSLEGVRAMRPAFSKLAEMERKRHARKGKS